MDRLARSWRRVSQFHEAERLIAFAGTWPGRTVVFVAAWCLLFELQAPGISVVAMAAATIWREQRRTILSVCAVAYLALLLYANVQVPGREDLYVENWMWVVVAGAQLIGLCYLCFLAARSFAHLPRRVQRTPLLFLHGILLVLLVWLWFLTSRGVLAPLPHLLAALLPFLLWRCSYLLLAGKRGSAAGTRFRDHLFYLWPAFGGSNTPYGKGFDYLNEHEARTEGELARSQLAGLKLLWLAWLWTYAEHALSVLVYGDVAGRIRDLAGGWSAGLPRLWAAIPDAELSIPMAWAAIYGHLISSVLWIAIYGHAIVGVLRLCGFRVFRNTYKPLLSETLLDFWSRYYYYFKELLVELFFYPTYLRWFKRRPRLRLLAATFAAAFFGNAYYHVLIEGAAFAAGDFATVWLHQGPRLVYCFLLALGVYVSMSRQQARRGRTVQKTGWRRRWHQLRAIAGVWTFFALILVWNTTGDDIHWLDRFEFLLSLVGLRGVLF